jgi:hypothetical protein
MARDQYYVSPLLSTLAVDYSKKIREGLVGSILFPRIPVGKPSGPYAVFTKEDAYKVPDTTMSGNRAKANEVTTGGEQKTYASKPHALKAFIDKAEMDVMDGPFKLWEKRKTEYLVTKLELSQEKRIAEKVLNLNGRTKTLSNTGATKNNKWTISGDNTGGNPYQAIRDGIDQLFFHPNVMILPESVFDGLEFHPVLLDLLGEANMIKKVNEETLAKLFRIDKVIIAKGKADFSKKKNDKSVSPLSMWGNSVVIAYTSTEWDEPCCGKTVAVKYKEADDNGYIVRTWEEKDGGLLGGEYVQVGHDVDELVVASDLIYVIKDVL